MLRLAGERELAVGSEVAWQKLSDATFLAGCIPDVETVKHSEPEQAELVIRPGLAFLRGTLDVAIRRLEASPGKVVWQLISKGIGSSSTVEATLAVEPGEAAGSTLRWTAEVKELGGLLKLAPPGLMQAAAQKVINDVLGVVEKRLAERA